MARLREDGRYQSIRGHIYNDEGAAQADNRRFRSEGGNQGTSRESLWFLGVFGKLIWIIPLLGLLAIIALLCLAFFRGYLILAARLPLFGAAGITGLAFGSIGFIKSRGLFKRLFTLVFLTLIVSIPLCFGAYGIYARTEKYFSTMFSADYIQALPDGSAPKLYEKRFQKGKVLTELKIDEYVKVNGITINANEFNITTAGGLTGWVPLTAFPNDAAEMLGITIEMGGFEQEQIQTDRYTLRLMQKYLGERVIRSTLGKDSQPLEYGYSMSEAALNRSIKVNAQTPLLYITSKEYREGAAMKDTGVKVTLANIVYADNCTFIYVTVPLASGFNTWPQGAGGNSNAWRNGLIVTDLATGQVYRALKADYAKSSARTGQPPDWIETTVFFFPPFKSRYFSLTREVLPMPPLAEVKEGYSGLLGWLDNMISGNWDRIDSSVSYNHWEFPEVRVR